MSTELERLQAHDRLTSMVESQMRLPETGIDSFWISHELVGSLRPEFWVPLIDKVVAEKGAIGLIHDETDQTPYPNILVMLFAADTLVPEQAKHMRDVAWKFLEYEKVVTFMELTNGSGHFEIDLLTGDLQHF